MIDHINGDRKDNRLCNLRDSNYVENGKNRAMSKRNSSGVPGVHKFNNAWLASFKKRDGSLFTRYYTDLEKAKREIPKIRKAEGYNDRKPPKAA